jgi:putative tryptophan/tyrosine transport system substrate-binding protein
MRNGAFPFFLSRRDALIMGAASLFCAGSAAAWQERLPIIGVLRINPKDVNEGFAEPFGRYMKERGWDEDRNVRFLFRWAGGRNDRIPGLVDELVAKNVAVLVVFGNPAIQAAQRATSNIPIVGMSDDWIGAGLAASMAHPGGNTTGVSLLNTDLDAKRLELLHEFIPQARRVGVLVDPTTSSSGPEIDNAARAIGLELVAFPARNRDEVARALEAMTGARLEAVNVLASPVLNNARDLVIERMRQMRLPAIYQWPEVAEEGGLLGYGPPFLVAYRHIVDLVDKILHGAVAGELPIEQPNTFELVVNLKTAKAIGLTFSAALLLRADRVIE